MEKKNIQDFKELKIWKLGIEIVKDTYKLTRNFPKDESYGLTSQIRRSAVSIPSNIAEGFKRNSQKEFKRFLYISLGSIAELETHIIISKELHYIPNNLLLLIQNKLIQLNKMIYALINKLKGTQSQAVFR